MDLVKKSGEGVRLGKPLICRRGEEPLRDNGFWMISFLEMMWKSAWL